MMACVIGDESAVDLLVENGAKISLNLVIRNVVSVSHNLLFYLKRNAGLELGICEWTHSDSRTFYEEFVFR